MKGGGGVRLKGSEKLKFENGAYFALWTRTLSHDDVKRIYEAGRKGLALGDIPE